MTTSTSTPDPAASVTQAASITPAGTLAAVSPRTAPAVAMLRLLGGFQLSQALYVVARAGVCDRLADGPRPVAELAGATGLRPELLRRLVRTLAGEDVFAYDAGRDTVALGRLGHTLCGEGEDSLRDVALMWMDTHYRPFARLWSTVHDGVPAADREYGEPFFDWLAREPERVSGFSAAMASLMRTVRRDALDGVDLSGVRRLVDIGGADGTALASLARRYPDLRGTVFDLPHVVAEAPALLAREGVADRVDTEGGDFFAAVPAGADAYLACFILHDWSDERCGRILDAVRAASAPGARLFLVETVFGEGAAPEVAALLDLTMMAMLDGRERTRADWAALLGDNGFRLDGITQTTSPMCVIAATRR
ncbi:hydroxyneurosporene-O-methyltransferase [Streptomyces spiroverticillatus]|uniref:Hydroxyneurosporene-O-methyltransferase n=1 Tax=Streptomyces finlayi TaxID=67296 RepID=A0A919CBE5_9ACTN|nr:methyltransferase [Streptomyces finlayi]GHA17193.1 hydroxyneurosporene-O-methyltransferase [Streptomyces spiroverticillatus]GHC99189.1 hydroxyneurosporene-O-methyltransferase [Streptomyces finlayi]